MIQQPNEASTPREHDVRNFEREMFDKQAAHVQEVKRMELEVAKYEAKWTGIWKLPVTLVKLPVLVVMAVGYCLAVWKGKEPSQDFWRFLR